jgi:membrane-bound serine protease (ClpP class)
MRVLLALSWALALQAGVVVTVTIDGVVHPVTAEIVGHAIEDAQRTQAAAVLIQLNTPGGLVEATRRINEKLAASPVPVITYVTPSGGRAASAGFLILQAGDVAAMAPGTNTGAASPVLMSGEMDATMRQKIENDLAAAVRSMTERRGRNAQFAEAAVRKASACTETEALAENVVDLVAANEHELMRQLDGREIKRFSGAPQRLQLRDVTFRPYQLTWRETVMSWLSDPNVAFILLALGALGVYWEFSSPGLWFPGVVGGILALLGLSGLSLLPINGAGVGLLILALVLFALEAKFTSHGILGAGGAAAMVLGAVLLIDAPPEFRIRWSTALSVALPFAGITLWLLTLVIRARRNKSLTGVEAMLSEIGVARSALTPAGMVMVRGEYWEAVSDQPVQAGQSVRVLAVEGLKLRVAPRDP